MSFGKRCPGCNQFKHIKQFTKAGPPGKAPMCKSCQAKTGEEHRTPTDHSWRQAGTSG